VVSTSSTDEQSGRSREEKDYRRPFGRVKTPLATVIRRELSDAEVALAAANPRRPGVAAAGGRRLTVDGR
jgi:hypothetical protein